MTKTKQIVVLILVVLAVLSLTVTSAGAVIENSSHPSTSQPTCHPDEKLDCSCTECHCEPISSGEKL
jgi:hypothetical protein